MGDGCKCDDCNECIIHKLENASNYQLLIDMCCYYGKSLFVLRLL